MLGPPGRVESSCALLLACGIFVGCATAPGLARAPAQSAEQAGDPLQEIAAQGAPSAPGAAHAQGSPDAQGEPGSASAPGYGDAPASEAEPERALPWLHGSVQLGGLARWTEGAHDNDLYALLSLDAGDPQSDKWSGHLMARGYWDLDGVVTAQDDPFFYTLENTFGSAFVAQLYEAYVDVHSLGPVDDLRIGRQFAYDTPVTVWFDGARADSEELGKARWQFGLYGGIPVHQYESSVSGDSIVGVYAQVHPWKSARLRGDWMHVVDEQLLAQPNADLISFDLFQSVGKSLQLEGRYSLLDEASNDLLLQATWTAPEDELTVRASYFNLFAPMADLPLEFNPFFLSLLTLFPYQEIQALASKDFGENWNLQGGVDVRVVSDDGDVGEFNRNFERYYLTATAIELLPGALTLALTGEWWDGDGEDFGSWGADLSRRWGTQVDASIGSNYALYKFDPFFGDEQDSVRTYYLALRYRPLGALTFGLRYEFEDNVIGNFNTVLLEATWRF